MTQQHIDTDSRTDIRDGFAGTVGNTPLIRLRRASEETGCDILGKAEFLNPGGSVKDRAALFIIRDAEERGALKPGGVVVEGTAGNTGIGLALVGNALGYRTVIVMPETQSQEKKDMLRLAGAELRLVPARPYRDPDNYVHVSERAAGELAATEPNGVLWANQWDNLANCRAHVETTAPEIWRQTGGRVDAFRIPDREALPILFDLLREEGLCLGGSSGINIAAAIRLARQLGPGHTIVTILCDGGQRYQSKLYNPDFLRSKDLPVPGWLADQADSSSAKSSTGR